MDRTSYERRPGQGREVPVAGAIAGVLGGLVMMAWMMAAAALDGDSLLAPLRDVGTLFRGADASRDGAGTVAWGIALHLAVGAALGIGFAALVSREMTVAASMVLGGGCALFWMAIAVKFLIPWLGPVLAASLPRHGGAWVLAHAVFGAVAGMSPWIRRRLQWGAPRRDEADRRGVLRPRTAP